MQVYVSNREIEEIADGLLQITCGKNPPMRIDIDAIAAYLGLTVAYETLAEDDPDKIGFLSDGKTEIKVQRNRRKTSIVFPKNYVVLERLLLQPEENNRRRFTLAHEIGHFLLHHADPALKAACFNRVYDSERIYDVKEMRERMSLCESQANTMAAMLLMPPAVLMKAVYRNFHKKTVPVYGEYVLLPNTKIALQKMSEELGVSYTALFIQMRKYKMFEQHDMNEYFVKTLCKRR